MIQATIKNNQVGPTLTQLAIRFPREYQKALMDLGARYRNRMVKEIKRGNPGDTTFQPLSGWTIRLRQWAEQFNDKPANNRRQALARRRKRESSGHYEGFAGRLPALARYKMMPRNEGVSIGFLDDPAAAKAVVKFQRSEHRAWTIKERAWWHRRFGNDIPFIKDKPERQAVNPYVPLMKAEALDVITKSIRANLANKGKAMRI